MIGIRQRLILGFSGLLAVVIAIGLMSMAELGRLGTAIDVILRENYRSVVACQNMKESLERMDSGLLYTLTGNAEEGNRLFKLHAKLFLEALHVELGNITLPGEQDKAKELESLFETFLRQSETVTSDSIAPEVRKSAYYSLSQPTFIRIKDLAQAILEQNQANMSEANDRARTSADAARQRMLTAIILAALLTAVLSYLARRWILRPINRLIDSTNEIRQGNLELVLKSESHDEIGRLSESFNAMAAALRRVRKKEKMDLARSQHATETVFENLAAAIAVLDLDGRVEISTETAKKHFGLNPGVLVSDLKYEWMEPLIRRAIHSDRLVEGDSGTRHIQQFIDGREYFFHPTVIRLPVGSEEQEPTGVVLILKDVTSAVEQRELKKDMISTVSHQLRTPLTSLRMSVHLLLEEKVGPLNETQTELLVAAREDSSRLAAILDDLLDINRLESGKSNISPVPANPVVLVRETIDAFTEEARERGVAVTAATPPDLPPVKVDIERIRYVFSNLMSNALRFTPPGGAITVGASRTGDQVTFSVTDSGVGIAPEFLSRLFEPFYRAPGQEKSSGVGLGLSIVKKIVEAHGGTVSVRSTPGDGTTFAFTLPLAASSPH